MKKKLFILLILFIIFPSVNAKVCQKITESNVYTYLAKDYSDVSYCDDMVTSCGGKNHLCTSGCFPLSIASILKSYGNNVAPQRILPISICRNLLHKLFSSDVTREYFFRKTKGYAEARS